jgi:LPXTG-site transpeptidase (sortase) family protein
MAVVGRNSPALRAMRTWSKERWVALALIGLGVLLLAAVAGYYLYSVLARSQLGDLESSDPFGSTDQSNGFSSIYPGSIVPSLSWDNPRWTDVDYDSSNALFEGFIPVDGMGLSVGADGLPAPARIEIPAIGLSSTVKALEIINYGDARGWETPTDVVGHIPTTPNPGEAGTGYLFGHLQSPIRGEGSIFRNLKQIPDMLRKGQDIYVVLYNEEDTAYLYQVSTTTSIPQEDFTFQHSYASTIIMVACVPAYVYDQRLLVTANLIGVKG